MPENNHDHRSNHADSIIRNHMIWSMGAGFIPVPIADFFAVSAVQLDMIRQLSKLYELDFKETQGKALITSLTGSGLARIGARAVKFIPGVGSVLGGVTMAVLSGASSYALGEVFKKHFETGGTFLDFDVSRLKKYYNEMFEKGKEMAKEYREKAQEFEKMEQSPPKTTNGTTSDPVGKLKELIQMKKDGILSEAEFEKMKNKILDS